MHRIFSRVLVLLVSALCLLFFFFGSGVSITADALEGGRFLTPEEALQIFGSEISVKYYNGTEYVDAVARYQATDSIFENFWTDSTGYLVSGRQLLRYSFSASGLSNNPDYIVVDLSPQYSIFDTSLLYTSIGVTAPVQSIDVYQSPQWEWYLDGERRVFEAGSIANAQNQLQRYRLQSDKKHYVCFVPAYYTSQSTFSGYSLRATFSGATAFSGQCEVLISIPYLSEGASGNTGIITTVTTQQGGIDMSGVESGIQQTNDVLQEHTGLLGRIIDFLQYIGESIHGDESEVSEVEPIETMENPPDWDDAMSQVESALDDVPDVTASGGFIWSLYNSIMTTSPVIKFLVPFGLVITLLSYIWWKK